MDIANLSGKTVLVTGAASGIGKETALAFARRGANLIICDRNDAGLAETAARIQSLGRDVISRRVDVANRDEMGAFAATVHAQIPAVDILMNNAGVALGATFCDTGLEDWDWILGINLLGVIHGCHFFIPAMVARGRGGHVINTASTAAFAASTAMAAYGTTKFAVLGLSEALRDELARHHIGVTAICPGVINTPIVDTAVLRGAMATPKARQFIGDTFRRRNYGPERVAQNVLKAVQRNRAVAPISPEAWLTYYLKRLWPGAVRWLGRYAADRTERELGVTL